MLYKIEPENTWKMALNLTIAEKLASLISKLHETKETDHKIMQSLYTDNEGI